MSDFFGYDRTVAANGGVATSEHAVLSLGTGLKLVQSVQASYGQKTIPKYEAGSADMHWVTGQPMGTIKFGMLVGSGGVKASMTPLSASCGKLLNMTLDLSGSNGCSGTFTGGFKFTSAVVESVDMNVQVGNLDVQIGATLKAGNMEMA